jgi:hypothetical protein
MRTNQKSFLELKTGAAQRQHDVSRDAVYYSFTHVAGAIRQRCSAPAYEQVCARGTIAAGYAKSTQKRPPTINAFLTLSAVTKW